MKTHFLVLGILILISSCKKDDPNPLQGCCDNAAIDENVGNGHVYIPNIITPDGDGINDLLAMYSDSQIKEVLRMEVRNSNGKLVFSRTDFPPNDSNAGWNGTENGTVWKGIYTVTWEIEATDGTIRVLVGDVCNYPCGTLEQDDKDQVDFPNCQYAIQTTDGHFDPTIPNGEPNECFE